MVVVVVERVSFGLGVVGDLVCVECWGVCFY